MHSFKRISDGDISVRGLACITRCFLAGKLFCLVNLSSLGFCGGSDSGLEARKPLDSFQLLLFM